MLKSFNWDHFVTEYYARSSVVLDASEAQSPFTVDQGLEVAARMLEASVCDWKNEHAVKIKDPKLPQDLRATMKDFSQFIESLQHLNDIEQFTFSQHNCHSFLPELKEAARRFLQPLFERVGIPSNGVNIVLLGGHYRDTPAGLHNDPADIFMFPLVGGKRLLTWPHRLWDDGLGIDDGKILHKRLPHINWRSAVDKAAILNAKPGDILYFPAGTWHVNSYLAPTNSLALAVSIFRNSDLKTMVRDLAAAAFRAASDETSRKRSLRSVVDCFETVAKISQLQRETAVGFVTGRQRRNDVSQSINSVRLASANAIQAPHPNGDIIFVCDGIAITLESSTLTHKFLESLFASGTNWLSINGTFSDGDVQTVRGLVNQLVMAGVLEGRQE